jgi:TRAP-type C4-dicarboxylate transport system substrate-binding protein
MTVTVVSDKERAAFAAAAKPAYDKWVEKIGKDLVETAKADMGIK